jgi:hypothetical protein
MSRQQEKRDQIMRITENQHTGGCVATTSHPQEATRPISPLAQLVVDELKKSGTRAWLGFPSPEERDLIQSEMDQREFQREKRREEAKERRMTVKKDYVRKIIRQSRDENV